MGGSAVDDDWELTSSSNGVRTVVLVGRTGNGKSATGNSILGRKAFKSCTRSSGVTSACELQSTVLGDGQIINVIDNPGLFDFSAESDFVGKEIVKCVNLAKDGIHAILVVFSVRTRFSQEEEAGIRSLQTLFGSRIIDYMIVVFTGGDELEDNDETLEDYFGRECPAPLKDILSLCKYRCVLFDNKTKDDWKKTEQVRQLLSLVNGVLIQNGGRPYTHELFEEVKEGDIKLHDQQIQIMEIMELKEQMQRSHDDLLRRITKIIGEDNKSGSNQNIVLNWDFSAGLQSWHPNSCRGFVLPHDSAHLGETPGKLNGNYAVIKDRNESWQGLEQDITGKISLSSTYSVSAVVGVSGTTHKSADVLATLRLEYRDSATSYMFIARISVSEGRWEKLEGKFSLSTMPDRLVFYIEGPSRGINLLIDSVVITGSKVIKRSDKLEGE